MLALGSPPKRCYGGFPIGAVKVPYVNFVYVDRIETTRIQSNHGDESGVRKTI